MSDLLSPKNIVCSGLCIGCGSCAAQFGSESGNMQFDEYGFLKPNNKTDWYKQKSEQFSRTCPFSPSAKKEDYFSAKLYNDAKQSSSGLGRFQSAYVGYVAENDFRINGSSGGMVSWVAAELLRKNLIDGVAHVIATENPQEEKRYFKYRISRTEDEIHEGAKSRYYPIELSGILQIIFDVPGRYAIIGIPCFIKAVNLLREENPILKERIQFTLGLFCGHMKSARFVESFAWQMNVPVNEVKRVEYRYKDANRPANWYNTMLTLDDGSTVNRDWWNLVDGDWGAGFFMNNACNYCDDVVAETADVSFGDAWVEPYSSDGRGTNVVVIRSKIVDDFVKHAIQEERLQLEEVDAAFVEQTQAAGFRQRREGLAYRLTWHKKGVKPCKRVAPDSKNITKQRKLIYRMRYFISEWSNKIFALSRKRKKSKLYLGFARIILSVYYGFAYHKGSFAEMKKRFIGLKSK